MNAVPTMKAIGFVVIPFSIFCTISVIFFGQFASNIAPRASNVFRQELNDTSTPKVVCMIHTTPQSWMTRARAVRHTWGPRCTFSIYYYSNEAASKDHAIRNASDAVGLNIQHGRGHLTSKTRAGLKHSLGKYGENADWFMKLDDDTYLVWENLVSLLNELQKEVNTTSTIDVKKQPLYLGRKFPHGLPHGYMSGGAGYVLNKPAAKLFLEGPVKHPNQCRTDGGYEDLEVGRCLASFSVHPFNTVDEKGKLRFHCSSPLKVLDGADTYYYIELAGAVFGTPKPTKELMLSEKAVTFHYITPAQILMFDYLLYHLKLGDSSLESGNNKLKSVYST